MEMSKKSVIKNQVNSIDINEDVQKKSESDARYQILKDAAAEVAKANGFFRCSTKSEGVYSFISKNDQGEEGTQGWLSEEGKILMDGFRFAGSFFGGFAVFKKERGGKWGYMKSDMTILAEGFDDAQAFGHNGDYSIGKFKKDGKTGYIDKEGNLFSEDMVTNFE